MFFVLFLLCLIALRRVALLCFALLYFVVEAFCYVSFFFVPVRKNKEASPPLHVPGLFACVDGLEAAYSKTPVAVRGPCLWGYRAFILNASGLYLHLRCFSFFYFTLFRIVSYVLFFLR